MIMSDCSEQTNPYNCDYVLIEIELNKGLSPSCRDTQQIGDKEI